MERWIAGVREVTGAIKDRILCVERRDPRSCQRGIEDLAAHIKYDEEEVGQRLSEGVSIDEKLGRASPDLQEFFSGRPGSKFTLSVFRAEREIKLNLREISWGEAVFGFRGGFEPIIDFIPDQANREGARLAEISRHLEELRSRRKIEQVEVIAKAVVLGFDIRRDVHWEVREEKEKEKDANSVA